MIKEKNILVFCCFFLLTFKIISIYYTNFDLFINGVKFDSIAYKTDQPIKESKILMNNERGFIVQSFIKNDTSIVNATFRIESSEDFVEFELPEDINSFNRMYVKKISDSFKLL